MFSLRIIIPSFCLLFCAPVVHAGNGEALYQQYCNACHGLSEDVNHAQRLAPPMLGVKRLYLRHYPNATDFVQAIADWVTAPNHDNSKMPGAVRRFGLMPAMPLASEQLQQIGAHIFNQKLLAPAGFDAHFKKRHSVTEK